MIRACYQTNLLELARIAFSSYVTNFNIPGSDKKKATPSLWQILPDDAILLQMTQLSDTELKSVCASESRVQNLCRDDSETGYTFWENRYKKRYKTSKKPAKTWKESYILESIPKTVALVGVEYENEGIFAARVNPDELDVGENNEGEVLQRGGLKGGLWVDEPTYQYLRKKYGSRSPHGPPAGYSPC